MHSLLFDAEHTTAPWDIGLSMGATRLMVLSSDHKKDLDTLKEDGIIT